MNRLVMLKKKKVILFDSTFDCKCQLYYFTPLQTNLASAIETKPSKSDMRCTVFKEKERNGAKRNSSHTKTGEKSLVQNWIKFLFRFKKWFNYFQLNRFVFNLIGEFYVIQLVNVWIQRDFVDIIWAAWFIYKIASINVRNIQRIHLSHNMKMKMKNVYGTKTTVLNLIQF